jgi:hypothetical protein
VRDAKPERRAAQEARAAKVKGVALAARDRDGVE